MNITKRLSWLARFATLPKQPQKGLTPKIGDDYFEKRVWFEDDEYMIVICAQENDSFPHYQSYKWVVGDKFLWFNIAPYWGFTEWSYDISRLENKIIAVRQWRDIQEK